MEDLPELRPHPVIGKWLYVPQSDAGFESTAEHLTAMVLARDARIGMEPQPRKTSKRSQK